MRNVRTQEDSLTNKFSELLTVSSKDALAIVLRMYGFEGLLRRLRPPADIDERIAKLVQVQTGLGSSD